MPPTTCLGVVPTAPIARPGWGKEVTLPCRGASSATLSGHGAAVPPPPRASSATRPFRPGRPSLGGAIFSSSGGLPPGHGTPKGPGSQNAVRVSWIAPRVDRGVGTTPVEGASGSAERRRGSSGIGTTALAIACSATPAPSLTDPQGPFAVRTVSIIAF